jgi:chaperonin GroES
MTLKPLFDKVVLKQVEVQETTKAGIILPGSAQEKPEMAEVVAVGPGGIIDGNEVKMTLKVGDKVITGKYSGTEVKIDGVEYTIVSQSDVLAVVE